MREDDRSRSEQSEAPAFRLSARCSAKVGLSSASFFGKGGWEGQVPSSDVKREGRFSVIGIRRTSTLY